MRISSLFRFWVVGVSMVCMSSFVYAQPVEKQPAVDAVAAVQEKAPAVKPVKVLLMIAEQNIESPQKAWWASQVDLSVTEARIANALNTQRITIVDAALAQKSVTANPAFSVLNISDAASVQLAGMVDVQYVALGKAVASSGGAVPASTMRSFFANTTVKLIRVKDGTVAAYLDASGKSVHVDAITGGKEALVKAADELAERITQAIRADTGI